MLDLSNWHAFTLGAAGPADTGHVVAPLLVPGEAVVASFAAVHDVMVFTDKRLLAVTAQGITGRKRDVTSLPYSRVQAFSVGTAGTVDAATGLDLWFGGPGGITLSFEGGADVRRLAQLLAVAVL